MSDDFLDKSYVDRLSKDYSIVSKTNLPNGIYIKHGGGYQFYIHDEFDEDTGFVVVTEDGIRGMYSGESFVIENGMPIGESIYKIMSRKDLIRDDKISDILGI